MDQSLDTTTKKAYIKISAKYPELMLPPFDKLKDQEKLILCLMYQQCVKDITAMLEQN